jgi:hypothetical protein
MEKRHAHGKEHHQAQTKEDLYHARQASSARDAVHVAMLRAVEFAAALALTDGIALADVAAHRTNSPSSWAFRRSAWIIVLPPRIAPSIY